MKRFIFIILMCCSFALAVEASEFELNGGSGCFIFADQKGDPEKPINVWYYKPTKYTESSQILFVMHGIERDAEAYRDQWVKYAEQYNVLLLVPEFSQKYYSGSTYPLGNMLTDKSQFTSDSRSGFSLIEHLFDFVASRVNNRNSSYYLYGHSAGGQFVHRMVLFKPDAHIKRAVAANAGFYTLPRDVEEFPYGLGNSLLTPETLKKVFQKELIILLGDQDTRENHNRLNKSPGAMKQGKYRFARGMYFFEVAKEESSKLGIPLAWKQQTVAGAGHSNSQMARAAAQYLFAK